MSAARLRARWVLPVTAEPIADGAVLVDERGRIAAVGPQADVPDPPGVPATDLGAAVLLPGLVNTHAHLELTALRGLVRERPFPRWVRAVRTLKDALGPEDFRAAARWGVLESLAAGITTTGDTGSTGAAAAAMADLGVRGIAYQEVFGPDPARADDALRTLAAALPALEAHASERVAIGVSPHAPYTVSAALLAAVVGLARARGMPIAMHLAESHEEDALITDGAGPFADALRGRGIAVAAHDVSPVEWAAAGGLLAAGTLLIHVVQTRPHDWAAIAASRAAVALCPWSNVLLGHGLPAAAGLRSAGVRIGVGTDSVAAGGPVDLFRDARMVAAAAGLTARQTIALMTGEGAEALGLTGVGALEPGAWADCVAVEAGGPSGDPLDDPEQFVAFAAVPADVVGAWVAGRCRYDRGSWPGVDARAERDAIGRAGARARAAVVSKVADQGHP